MLEVAKLGSLRDAFIVGAVVRWCRSYLAQPPATSWEASGFNHPDAGCHYEASGFYDCEDQCRDEAFGSYDYENGCRHDL